MNTSFLSECLIPNLSHRLRVHCQKNPTNPVILAPSQASLLAPIPSASPCMMCEFPVASHHFRMLKGRGHLEHQDMLEFFDSGLSVNSDASPAESTPPDIA